MVYKVLSLIRVASMLGVVLGNSLRSQEQGSGQEVGADTDTYFNFRLGQTNVSQKSWCLEIKGSSTSSGTPVVLNTCTSSKKQAWRMDGNDRIRSAANNGKCLHVKSNDEIEITSCIGGDNQKWKMKNGYNCKNRGKKLCLDNKGNDLKSGNKVIANTCNNEERQNWSRIAAMQYSRSLEVADYEDHNEHDPEDDKFKKDGFLMDSFREPFQLRSVLTEIDRTSWCLALKNENTSSGTSIVLMKCGNKESQMFEFSSDTKQIRSIKDDGKCLDYDGDKVMINSCTTNSKQKWQIQSSRKIKNRNNDLCIGNKESTLKNGNHAVLYKCSNNNQKNQMWSNIYADPEKCDDDQNDNSNDNVFDDALHLEESMLA